MQEENKSLLELEGIQKDFWKDGESFPVLKGVSLALQEGERFVLLGRSGCGKTTLLRCMGGFLQPDAGEVLLEGNRVEHPGADRMMVFQDFNQLFPWMTLKKNLTYALKKVKPSMDKTEREAAAMKFLQAAGLSGFENQYPMSLSGGMKQRGALARALALEPKLLLMDEPFSSLDYLSRQTARQTVLSLQEQTGCTIFLVTHDIEEAAELGTRIGILDTESHSVSKVYVTEEYKDRVKLVEELKRELVVD